MDRIDALKALLAKVEAGDLSYQDTVIIVAAFPDIWNGDTIVIQTVIQPDLNGMLDLHEAVLPYGYDSFETFSLSGEVVLKRMKPVDRFYGFSDGNPARAWLIAILKALAAQDEDR